MPALIRCERATCRSGRSARPQPRQRSRPQRQAAFSWPLAMPVDVRPGQVGVAARRYRSTAFAGRPDRGTARSPPRSGLVQTNATLPGLWRAPLFRWSTARTDGLKWLILSFTPAYQIAPAASQRNVACARGFPPTRFGRRHGDEGGVAAGHAGDPPLGPDTHDAHSPSPPVPGPALVSAARRRLTGCRCPSTSLRKKTRPGVMTTVPAAWPASM